MSKTLYVTAHGKRLRIVLLNTVDDVVEKWNKLFGKPSIGEMSVDAFYTDTRSETSYGTIYLPRNSNRLRELAIHESTHAAIAHVKRMGAEDLDNSAEEHIANLAGVLASRVLRRIAA
jgi:hypothetical protein